MADKQSCLICGEGHEGGTSCKDKSEASLAHRKILKPSRRRDKDNLGKEDKLKVVDSKDCGESSSSTSGGNLKEKGLDTKELESGLINRGIDKETVDAAISLSLLELKLSGEAKSEGKKEEAKQNQKDKILSKKKGKASDVQKVGNPTKNPDMDSRIDRDRKMFAEVTGFLEEKKSLGVLLTALQGSTKIMTPDYFHQLVVQLKQTNQLKALLAIPDGEVETPLHRIIRKTEVQEQTLDILSEAGVNFNVLDRYKRNVLYSAIWNKQSTLFLESLIRRGAKVNQVDSGKHNLIALAVSLGCTDEMLQFLISKGLKVNTGKKINSPLAMLKHVKNLERTFSLFKILVKAGAKPVSSEFHDFIAFGFQKTEQDFRELVEFIASEGKLSWFNVKCEEARDTPFQLALSHCKVDVETLKILQKAVDFTYVNKTTGDTALHCAIRGGNWDILILQVLINNRADVKAKTTVGKTLLHYAAEYGAPLRTFVFLIGKRLDILAKDNDNCTALETAITGEKFPIIKNQGIVSKLLIWTFDAMVIKSSKALPKSHFLNLAVQVGTADEVKHILEKGVFTFEEINTRDKEGLSPFLKAVAGDKVENAAEKARLLVKHGAIARSGLGGTTPVHFAAKTGTLEALKYCIEELRLNIGAEDECGNTPLHVILSEKLSKEQLEKAKFLVLSGARVNANANPFPEARPIGRGLNKNLLPSPFHLALNAYKSIDDLEILEFVAFLLENNAKVSQPNLEGLTPIHVAMYKSDKKAAVELLKVLQSFGADFTEKTPTGQSVLHLAAERRNVEGIKFSLEKGLDVDAVDKYGISPLLSLLPTEDEEGEHLDFDTFLDGMKLLLKNGPSDDTKRKVVKELELQVKKCKEEPSKQKIFLEILNLITTFAN